jgi:hypothetical protein
MEPNEDEDLGPVDVVIIGFPAGAPMTGEAVSIVLDLVDRRIIRVFDVLFVRKGTDGTVTGMDLSGLDEETVGQLTAFEGASSGLLDDDDAATAGRELEPGDAAVMIVYENRWAAPFAAAVRRSGGRMIANERIPVSELVNALDAAETPA